MLVQARGLAGRDREGRDRRPHDRGTRVAGAKLLKVVAGNLLQLAGPVRARIRDLFLEQPPRLRDVELGAAAQEVARVQVAEDCVDVRDRRLAYARGPRS
jgi:hypothetical protein